MQIFSDKYGPELFNSFFFVSEKLTFDIGNAKHGHLYVGLITKDEVKQAQRAKTKKTGQGGTWTSSVYLVYTRSHYIHFRALFIAQKKYKVCLHNVHFLLAINCKINEF